jgi:hypothetical protein
MSTGADRLLSQCEAVLKDKALRSETLSLLDDVIQLMSDLGENELCEKMHQIYLDLEVFANSNNGFPFEIVIELFAGRDK